MPWPHSQVPNEVSNTRPEAIANRLHDAIVIPGLQASPKVPTPGERVQEEGLTRSVRGTKQRCKTVCHATNRAGPCSFPTARERVGPDTVSTPGRAETAKGARGLMKGRSQAVHRGTDAQSDVPQLAQSARRHPGRRGRRTLATKAQSSAGANGVALGTFPPAVPHWCFLQWDPQI